MLEIEIRKILKKTSTLQECWEETPPADGALPLNTAALADLPAELQKKLEQALVQCSKKPSICNKSMEKTI